MWTSEVGSSRVKGTCRGIRAITPKIPVKTSSRQSRTEENFEESEFDAEDEYYKGVREGTEGS